MRGSVQGVGFRPFVHGLARRYGLAGFVANDAAGVLIEIEGSCLDQFLNALDSEAPPLARIDAIEAERKPARGERAFTIAGSIGGKVSTRAVPDAATCEACLGELFDPASRFHFYPFVNCTHCGPRYTITRNLPYDRPRTTMAGFAMCDACARDYADPGDRRFHAEAIGCPRCGPRLSHALEEIVARLRRGQIVALKGLGGFHLLCDARNEAAIGELRRRKQREAKPFAVMIASAASLASIAEAGAAELALLSARERPILLLRSRGVLPPSVAPGLAHLGVMLPCTPLHHLLFHAANGAPTGLALVATSANPAGEPLLIDDAEAHRRLAGIADLIVTHDRPIVTRADDPVMAIIDGAPAIIRRARGHVPVPVRLAREIAPVLALGGQRKMTVTLTRGREAFVSQHIGDLDNAESLRVFEETVAHLVSILDVAPVLVAHDLHPDFASIRFAERLGLPTIAVQHHHAHIAAIAAEYAIGPVLGLALDGYGFGSNGGNWGGELLLVDGAKFTPPWPFAAAGDAWRRFGGARAVAHGGRRAASAGMRP